MAYIRDNSEERTGYQASSPYFGKIDLQCDFVMVYNTNPDMPDRVAKYREEGYAVHLMTGIAWGGCSDYLSGEWDGRDHYDESQTDRFGNPIEHGKNCPYMVPTISFADFKTEKLKVAVDAGVEAIHVEEPEFWDRGGYSPAFKREYLLYYKEPWIPPHGSPDARYKAAKLKAYLYARTIERVSSALKEYALIKYGRVLRFYVPTHSLLNYTQWKIVSPEGKLADIPSVDGCIAQVWTGTSREKNWYNGVFAERTFETAYLEYGVMQELVKGTGRKMWFLHDPIEDNPMFDWDDYRTNYLKTVTASLLHPKVNTYEICPWPNRVFDGEYPKNSPEAEPIPADYASLLCGIFQTLGDIECTDGSASIRVGVLLSDTALYQRDYPDGIISEQINEKVGTVLRESENELDAFRSRLFKSDGKENDLMYRFLRTNAFPAFYGLCMPLLKCGMPVRPVLLDNIRRYNGYLDDYDVLILSYEYMKPDYPDINNALCAWVKNGGQLVYVGNGSDPYHSIKSWWTGAYPTAAEHLFEMLGISPAVDSEIFDVGSGTAAVWKTNPARFCFSKENAEEYRRYIKRNLAKKGFEWVYSNRLTEKRGPYIAAAVLDEGADENPLVFSGLYADMYSCDYNILTEKTVHPGENTLLFDLSDIHSDSLRVIGTTVRIFEMTEKSGEIKLRVRGPSEVLARIRLRVPYPIKKAVLDGSETDITSAYDEKSRTVLLSFESNAGDEYIILKK